MFHQMHAIGFGSLNLDEFWEVSPEFLRRYGLRTGEEYVKDLEWFERICADLCSTGELLARDPGGSAANMIAALCRMGFRTGFYGAAGGRDAEALRLTELGREEDLRIQLVDLPAGRCLALIDREDPRKDRALVILPNANDLAGSDRMDPDYFAAAKWVHLTSFVSREPLRAQIELMQSVSGTTGVSFDPGAVYAALGLTVLEPILRRSDLLFVTEEELETMTGASEARMAAATLFELGVRTIVTKLGDQGIRAITREQVIHQESIPPRQIRDRTGAGDVAAAGFLAGLIASLDLAASLELAAAAASRSIEGYGRHKYPDRVFFEQFVKRRVSGQT
ncbi:MAG: carbohydrate kinase family protein [Desulfomonile tiedjei]|nr:carbohydrate kinase family protein [Desulfomonile tiedjei]